MKPLLSICVLLILVQSLIFGNLVTPELPEILTDNFGLTLVQKQVLQEPYLIRNNASVYQNLLNRNVWFPNHLTNKFITGNISLIPVAEKMQFKLTERKVYYSIPVFLINGTLRL
jgi:hypothetical protein